MTFLKNSRIFLIKHFTGVKIQMKFDFQQHFPEFRIESLKNAKTWIAFTGWLILFGFIISTIGAEVNGWGLILFFMIYMWFWVNRIVTQEINPPDEFLVILLLIFYFFDGFLIKPVIGQSDPAMAASFAAGFLHIIFLTLEIFLVGLLIIRNNKNRQFVLVWFVILALVLDQVLALDAELYLVIFQVLLFFSLFKRTTWLENRAGVELTALFFVFAGLTGIMFSQSWYSPESYIQFLEKPALFSLHSISNGKMDWADSGGYFGWYSMPIYVHYLIKLYLLACAVKIPVAMVYNHAKIARKMWIASLFQSTIPQFIQMIIFLLLFYFFVAGWQASVFREFLEEKFEEIEETKTRTELAEMGIIKSEEDRIFEETFVAGTDTAYFLLKKHITDETVFKMIRLEQETFKSWLKEIRELMISGIVAGPFQPKSWLKPVYESDIGQHEPYVKIFPFKLIATDYEGILYTVLVEGDEQVDYKTFADEHAVLFLGRVFVPLLDNGSAAYFAFDLFVTPGKILFRSSFLNIIIALTLIFLLLNGLVIKRVSGFGAQITQIIVNKFEILKTGIKQIAEGNLEYKVKIEGADEFREIATHFNNMGDQLKKSFEELKEKERLDQELKIARDVQLSILPEQIKSPPGFQVVAEMQAANEVGGDFYDWIPLEKNKFLFVIGDVSGKGSSAAFYMAQFISLLRYSVQFTKDIAKILQMINEYFALRVSDKQIFVTALIGILNTDSSTLRFIRAGHCTPYLLSGSGNSVQEIRVPGIGIGLSKSGTMFKKSIPVHTQSLKVREKFVLVTDGVFEAALEKPTGNIEVYGEARLKDLLQKTADKNAREIIAEIRKDLKLFYGSHKKVDDYTLMIIEKEGK